MTDRQLPTAPPVVILLSTRDGAAFLPEFLASLQAQTHRDWCLCWRDDGSSDASPAIMAAFAAGEPRCCAEPATPDGPPLGAPLGTSLGTPLGAGPSFLALLRAVLPRLPPGTAIAFADQDDVWRPEKLARGIAALAGIAGPALACARQTLVDAALRPIGASPPLGTEHRFPAALAGNVAVGCTVLLNPEAAALLAASRPPDAFFHDWWAYALVTAAGGTCLCDPVEVILYRQHGGNLVGAARGPVRRALAALRRGPRPFTNRLRAMLDALAAQPSVLCPEAAAAVTRLRAALAGGLVPRAAALWALRARLRRRGAIETLLFRLWFLIG